ncbi:phosphotransferase [Halobacteria archaeon AArc-m2/3/4]|uniref:Phosphotransferase n=1 Tax=Natronoglomus mannanivorans TaxID=2979990 RepID=A0ABT2QG02_9EURY|nr:phosphotransferase [Halobacteria archaeon AArc-m2/3/4]
MDGRLRSAFETAFPDQEVTNVGSTGPSWNERNRTVEVEFTDGKTVYLKVALDGDGSRIARERAVIGYVGATDSVPVPKVLSSDPDGPVPYLVTEPVTGQPFLDSWTGANTEERATLARQVGRSLASLHDRWFDDHGHVVDGGADGLELRTGSWTDVLVDTIGEMRGLAPADRFDHHFDEVIAAVEENRELLDDAPAALLHGDPAKPNCFLDDGEVGLLDWEIAHVGDPARDLHRVRDQQIDSLRTDGPERLVTALYEGYRDWAGDLPDGFEERRPVYEAVRHLGTSGFFERVVEYVDESPDELERWVQAEMDRRLAEL